MLKDPREAFVSAIDAEKTKIESFSGFVFLCGGAFSNSSPDDNTETNHQFKSAREHIYNYVLASRTDLFSRFRLAEDIANWFDPDSKYSNLIDFELDVAELADLVVIFVESAGAIAELGTFCQNDSVARKVMIFIQSIYYGDESYIDKGPVQFLKYKYNLDASFYPWTFNNTGLTPLILESSQVEIVSDISEHLARVSRSSSFQIQSKRHQILLTLDILHACSALTITEMRNYLQLIGLEIDRNQLEKYLFILEKFDYIIRAPRGKQTFFVSQEQPARIRYSFRENLGVSPERTRRRAQILDYYHRTESEKKRLNAIQDSGQSI